MIANYDELKNECIKRMKILKLNHKLINDYETDEKIYVTDLANNNVSDVTSYQEIRNLVQYFEQIKKIKIYHIIHIEQKNVDKTYLLYVSRNSNEWKAVKNDIKNGFVEVYSYEEIRDFKTIGVETSGGKILRVV